ncbi:BTB/POZ domain-containing protein 9-like [Drosophila obscura]|uniref:BTB/POZ domain-containing protein 9-like n=1 Tax=Drosophila obscura TaxID=7282 RepID=UPI001BB11786|nr:BTB/POZ domain-containing protein 9-like [Drosophila obscura]
MDSNTDDIDHVGLDMRRLCLNDLYSDVDFLVEEQRLPAHRSILAARSDYFRAMLYGNMTESKEREIRLEVPVDAFKIIMRYIYTGTLPLSTLDVQGMIGVFGLAHLYGLQNVEGVINNHLQQNLAVSNVCMILNAARRYSMNDLSKECIDFMDRNASKLLKHQSFLRLSKESLEEVLRRDTFAAPEVKIFKALCKWSLFNPSVDIKPMMSHIRLPLMTVQQLISVVQPTAKFELNQIIDAIDQKYTEKNLPHRVAGCPHVLPGEKLPLTIRSENSTILDLNKISLINCIIVTTYGGGKWSVSVKSVEIWNEVGTFESKSNGITMEINFTERLVHQICITMRNASPKAQPEVKAVAMYTV